MGNDDSCGDSIGRDREGKINERGRTQCMEQQNRSDLDLDCTAAHRLCGSQELILSSCNMQIL